MKVLVLGSGVIGVTSAWYLHNAGHEVTLVDRQPQPARETSHANGGQISWGAGNPWAEPGIPVKALGWMFRRHAPLVFHPRVDPALWHWLWRMLGECTAGRYRINKARQLRLARYSHQCLTALRTETGINFDHRAAGVLTLYRNTRGLESGARDAQLLQEFGVRCQLIDRAACLAREPGLTMAPASIAGGLLVTEDESGDCRRFTEVLAERTQQRGVRFLPSTTVQQLQARGDRIESIRTNHGNLTADAWVLACGSYTPLLLKPLGVRLPVYPVKGYSITLPIVNEAAAPQGTLTDEAYKVVITRLGQSLRVAGTAELAGYDLSIPAARIATLKHVVREWFPQAGNLDQADSWAGLRPMTPDNPPVLGATPFSNLFLNTGHGTLGWTMACGSGKLLADLVSGREPEIDLDGLTLARFG